ncbi:MAG: type II/IV secretion system protein [Candidatus Competibacteraceae bacterium]|uniref:GspE/PulE family protein n=1 Tax=Candidatus Contendibacter odensensis TaxID=1400860 RepID=UPI00068839CF|nr:GspE/PulE family protein [Candidatus Contendobacter odensis]MBK8537334.1 type II/IV secretion system protein [Candidatus Competibacteraceae bacterium]MBK8753673.1 type II/IV secretion system protein [Candidatus Competibacteraceae bacterium]
MGSSPDPRSSPSSRPRLPEHRLTVKEVLDELVADGLVDRTEIEKVSAGARSERGELHPLVVITNKQLRQLQPPHQALSLEWLTEWLAGKVGLPYLRIDPLKLDIAAVERLLPYVSYEYAARYQILPVAADERRVVFATAEPYLTGWQDVLRQALRREIQRVIANPLDLNRYQLEFYGVSRSVRGALKGSLEPVSSILNFEQLLELGRRGELSADERPIVQIVDWLLQYAFAQRASDIHLEPRREQGQIRFRIDGVLNAIYQLPPPVMSAVTSRIKILGRMDVAEKRRPQDGRIKTRTPAGREIELRLSTMPTAFGEKCVLRIFDPDTVTKNFGQLGFAPAEEAIWRTMIARPHGIVLVTGPTGSGKTTTLYTTLKHLANPEVNVCTVEDPIEMVVPELNQMQVHPAIDLSFAQGIRTLLRQDPDIIMVGEIRDLEAAQMAVQAALTGHLVLSTLHTNDAASAVTRLLDLGIPHYLIQNVLIGVMAQRLVRTLCPHCKGEGQLDPALWDALIRPWSLPKPAMIREPRGCPECRNTGYLGRVGLYELLTVTPELRRLLRPDMDATDLRRRACEQGMRPLRVSAALQIAAGLTTFEEIIQVLPPLEEE